MLFAHPIQHVLQLVIVQIGERVLRKLDRRGGLVRIAELEKEESMRGLAGHSPEGEEARCRVVVSVRIHIFLRKSVSLNSSTLKLNPPNLTMFNSNSVFSSCFSRNSL